MRRPVARSRLAALAMVAALAVVAAGLAACSSGTPPTTAVSVDPAAPRVVARDVRFTTPVVSAPADRPFQLVFDNQESALHNVAIQAPGGGDLFTGELFSGPAVRVYSVPALAAGSYKFICSVHPEMVGELTVR